VRNEANIYNLTTFHGVYPKDGVDTDVLFAYLITDVAKKIFLDNSRQYGNGLIKFEPNDLNKGKVVDLTQLTLDEIAYVKEIYNRIKYSHCEQTGIILLNNFFEKKFAVNPEIC
jgi:adenine-specific DNA-methyltransferase